MKQRTWFITGISSGFGRQLTERLVNDAESREQLVSANSRMFRAASLGVPSSRSPGATTRIGGSAPSRLKN